MPRRREVPKRDVLPDPKFGSVELTKFMNVLMIDGKKSVAERIVYGALEQIEKKTGKVAIEVFNEAIANAKPIVEVKSRREVVQTTKFLLKFVLHVVWLWQCAGFATRPVNVVRNLWTCVWQVN